MEESAFPQVRERRHMSVNEEMFAREFVRTGNATGAYRAAYPKSANWRVDNVPPQAIRTLSRPKVRAYVRQLRGEIQSASAWSTAHIVLALAAEARLASANKQHGPAVRAYELIAKITGVLGKDDLAPTGPTVNVNVLSAVANLDIETLRALAARYDAVEAEAQLPVVSAVYIEEGPDPSVTDDVPRETLST